MAEEIEFEDAFLNRNNVVGQEQHTLSQGSNQVSNGCTYDGTGSSSSDSEGESDESSESEKRPMKEKCLHIRI